MAARRRGAAVARGPKRLAGFLLAATLAAGCAGARPAPRFVPPAPVPHPGAEPSQAAVGLVLTGGGAFGAWEAGALRAFFDVWRERHAEDPPIRVVAGTSTGALLAPAALLGREDVVAAGERYTDIRSGDVLGPRLVVLLPFPLFATLASAPFSAGYPDDGEGPGSRLHRQLYEALTAADLERLAAAWPERRLVATSTDFATGRPHLITNDPAELEHLRNGVFASAMVPLLLTPVPLPAALRNRWSWSGPPERRETPHLDGGVFTAAPVQELFELASLDPAIELTHVVVIGPFPAFPGADAGALQRGRFPLEPDYREIGERFATLQTEAAISKELALTRAAIALRRAGVDAEAVERETGFPIPGAPPRLLALRPAGRLGWRALRFEGREMRAMFARGYREARRELERALVPPESAPAPAVVAEPDG